MVKVILTEEQVLSLLEAAKKEESNGFIYALIWGIQFYLMRRVSEVVKLKIEEIDFSNQKIYFRTKTSNFFLRCPEHLLNDIRTVIGDRKEGYVFPTMKDHSNAKINYPHICRQSVSLRFRDMCKKMGYGDTVSTQYIRECKKCSGYVNYHPVKERTGDFCKDNQYKWQNLVPWKKCIREGRPHHEIKEHMFHSHVLRASGAMALIERGYTEIEVMRMGHWLNRKSFEAYVVLSERLNTSMVWENARKDCLQGSSIEEQVNELKLMMESLIALQTVTIGTNMNKSYTKT